MRTLSSTITAALLLMAAATTVQAQGASPAPAGTTEAAPGAPIPAPSAAPAEPAPPPPPAPATPPTPPPAPPSPIAAAAAASPPPAAPASEGGGPGPVERLPPSAYPEEYTRGIYGGSLWSTFHGVQWPYYARTGIGVSGYAWIDNSFEQINVGLPTATFDYTREYLQQGRVLLRVTPTYARGDLFVQAQVELVGNKDQSATQPTPGIVDADDVWARIGQWRKWDLMFGRFEAFEIYHRGMGLDINTEERLGAFDQVNTPPDIYGATFMFDRPARPGNVAFHYYPYRYLRIELLAQYGGLAQFNEIGGRPAAVFDIGWLKLKAAAEYQWLTARNQGDREQKQNRGFAGSAQFVYGKYVEGGINYGYANNRIFTPTGILDSTRTAALSSIGVFVNARVIEDLLVGAGFNYVSTANEHFNTSTGYSDFATNTQTFVAIQYLVWKQLFVKAVGAYANSRFEQSFNTSRPYNDQMFSARLRVLYLF
jgi:hypothetical protein